MVVSLTNTFFISMAFLSYWISSISTVFLNKFFLTKSEFNFCILFVQNGISAILAYIWIQGFGRPQNLSAIFSVAPTRNLLILMTITYVTSLSLNNICLRLVTVSFFQVARSLNLISTVTFSYMLLGQKQSQRSLFCCMLVVCGFWFTVDQESGLGTLDIYGVIFGLSASVSLGVQVVLIRKALDAFSKCPNPDALLCFFTNSFSLPLLAVLVLISGEFGKLVVQYLDETSNFAYFWLLISFSGFLTFAIAVSSNACIRLTSPLSHNISVQTKSVVQTLVACWYYNEIKTWLWWTGNSTVVMGAATYTLTKFIEGRRLLLPATLGRTNDTGKPIANGQLPANRNKYSLFEKGRITKL